MRFDAAAYLGEWPFFELRGTVAALRRSMVRTQVTHALVSPLQGFFQADPTPANAKLLRALAGHGNLYAAPILNPKMANWEQQLAEVAGNPQVRAVRLAPGFHGYACEAAGALAEAAGARRRPVIVQTKFQDRRNHPPLANMPEVPIGEALDLAASLPAVRFVLAAMHRAELTGAGARIAALPNVWMDMSHLDGLACVRQAAEAVGFERVLLGTCWPFFYATSALLKVSEAQLPRREQGAILGGNARRLFRIR